MVHTNNNYQPFISGKMQQPAQVEVFQPTMPIITRDSETFMDTIEALEMGQDQVGSKPLDEP